MKKIFFAALFYISSITFMELAHSKEAPTRFCDSINALNQFHDLSSQSIADLVKNQILADRVLVSKNQKKIYIISGNSILRSFTVAFGPQPNGHKQFEGDGKTPEGLYEIDFKIPSSEFHQSLHISYPNSQDQAFANSKGRSPGGSIMIHGFPSKKSDALAVAKIHPKNWTRGCIAVTNTEIEELYRLVPTNTVIEICRSMD